MNWINQVRYFFYVGFNWNFYVAGFLLYHEIIGEKQYGLNSSGYKLFPKKLATSLEIQHATMYMPASYYLLEKIFDTDSVKASNHLLDIGCGKGRILSVALQKGIPAVTGIDFDKDLCEAALQNLLYGKHRYPKSSFEVIASNASSFDIPNTIDVIVLFNPFDELVLQPVLNNIQLSLKQQPRKLTVVYINPVLKHLFLEQGFKEVKYYKKLTYLEYMVLSN
jgi:SAM-dependent methyltransferase